MATRMLQRRGTTAEWVADNPILGDGEIGYDRTTKIIKMGDGVTAWEDLDTAHLNKSGGTMTGALTLIAPTSANHAARKTDVDVETTARIDADNAEATARADADTGISNNLSTHEGLTNPHSATASPTASRIALRDVNGRSQFATPSVDADVATKGYVDGSAIPKSLIDAAGDILVGTGPGAIDRVAKGAINTFLNIDGSGNIGWAAAGGATETTIKQWSLLL